MKVITTLIALTAFADSVVFAHPAQTSPKRWTFRDLHTYVAARGGKGHPLAVEIEARMLSERHLTWETKYDDTITTDDGGGVLVTPRSALTRRAAAASSLTAYLAC